MPTDTDEDDAASTAFPKSFVTTIRVERTAPETYRASQHDADVEGYGSTPHLAVVDYARRAQAVCLGEPSAPTDGS